LRSREKEGDFIMKRYILLVSGLLLLLSPVVFAEGTLDIDKILSVINTKKKEVVAKSLVLTEKEKKAFWPLYDEYQKHLGAIEDQAVKLIEEYVAASQTMKDRQAIKILDGILDNEAKRITLDKSYAGKFRKILPVKKVIEYFYLEAKLEAMKRLQIAASLPLVY
jgi:hypothetical protein